MKILIEYYIERYYFLVFMIKKDIIFITACITSCVGASLETPFYSGIDTGDWGLPLIPRAHSYNATGPNIEFCRMFQTTSGPTTLSIQPMSSSGIGSEEISFKPQWSIFKGVAPHYFNEEKFTISIDADCNLEIIDNTGIKELKSKSNVSFHDPDMVSPDTMHLGFNRESPSKALRYNVTYSNGQGSDFAKSQNGTHQTGIILLLDDENINILKLFEINFCKTEEVFEVLKQLPFIQNTPLLLEQLKPI